MPQHNGNSIASVRMLLTGWTGLVLVFLYLPIAVLVVYSFNASSLNIKWEGFTLRWYSELWGDKKLMESVWTSMVVAAWTTGVSVLLGTTAAWLMHRRKYRGERLISTLIFLPMISPEVVIGVSLLVLFSCIIRIFPSFELGLTTLVIAHSTFCIPFVIAAVQARLADMDPNLEEAALVLGATPLQAFFRVILPYLLPGILSGGLMAFTLSMDEYIVSVFTAGHARTLPLEIYGRVKVGLDGKLYAISTLFIILTTVLVVVANRAKRWKQ